MNPDYYIQEGIVSVYNKNGGIISKNVLMATSAHYNQSKDIKSVFKDECISTAKLFTYSSMWNVHGLSSILNTKVLSIYPMYNLRLRPLYHRLIYPRERTLSAHNSCIAIMWTRTPPLPLSTREWNPNHFVPCVPLSRLSLEQTTSISKVLATSTNTVGSSSSCTSLQSNGSCSMHESPPPDLAVYKPRHRTTPAVTSVSKTVNCIPNTTLSTIILGNATLRQKQGKCFLPFQKSRCHSSDTIEQPPRSSKFERKRKYVSNASTISVKRPKLSTIASCMNRQVSNKIDNFFKKSQPSTSSNQDNMKGEYTHSIYILDNAVNFKSDRKCIYNRC